MGQSFRCSALPAAGGSVLGITLCRSKPIFIASWARMSQYSGATAVSMHILYFTALVLTNFSMSATWVFLFCFSPSIHLTYCVVTAVSLLSGGNLRVIYFMTCHLSYSYSPPLLFPWTASLADLMVFCSLLVTKIVKCLVMRVAFLVLNNPGQSSLKLQILFFPILGLTCIFKMQKIILFSLMSIYTCDKNRLGRAVGKSVVCFTFFFLNF